MSDQPQTLADDLIWGVADIATFIGRTQRQTWEMLNKGELPAVQPNGRWCASRARLRAFFVGAGVAEAQSAPSIHAAPPAPAAAPVRRAPQQRTCATVHKLVPRPGKGRAA